MEGLDKLEQHFRSLLEEVRTLKAEKVRLEQELSEEREKREAVAQRIDGLLARVQQEITD